MSNIIKYSGGTTPNSIKSGNFNIGVNSTPTDLTGFYNGISPIIGGYTIYINKAENGPSIYAPKNDSELVSIVQKLGGSVSTAADALVWINSQSNMTVLNNNYPSIVTDGLVLNLDAGFVSSYPKTGTTWRDLSGNGNNGTLVNGVGFSGGSMVFDGVDDYISLGNSKSSLIQGKTNFTIGIMFKMTTLSSLRGLIGTLNYGCGSNLGLVAASSSLLFYNDTTSCYNVTPAGFSIEVGKWIYAVGTYDGTTTRIYAIKDNVLYQGSGTSKSGPTNTFTSDFRVMGNQYPLYFTNGECVMAFVYNRALSQEEVYQNYYAGLQRFIPTDGLVLSLDAQNTNLYATSPTTAYDISGNNYNGTLTNGVQYVANGDGSWSFDQVDDSIANVGDVSSFSFIQNTGIFTVCAWVRLTQFTTTQSAIMGNNRNVTTEKGFLIAKGTSSNAIRVVLTNGSGTNSLFTQQINNYFLNDNWVFVTIVGDGTKVIFYRNGSLFQNGNNLGTLSEGDSTRTLSVGRVNASTLWWSGNISQTSIYDIDLSSTEISTIYNATKSRYGL